MLKISSQYGVTSNAFRCRIQSAVAVLGGLTLSDPIEPGQVRLTVTQFVVHNGFMEGTDDFDVALAVLPIPVSFTNNIRPVRLPNRRQVDAAFNGQQGTFMGWGRFGSGNTNSPVLRFGRSTIMTNIACRLNLPTNTVLDTNICTEGLNEQAGLGAPCAGETGAPLTIVDADGITTQVGVFSFNSVLGCESGRAAVFTRMSAYLTWIGENSDVEIRDGF